MDFQIYALGHRRDRVARLVEGVTRITFVTHPTISAVKRVKLTRCGAAAEIPRAGPAMTD
jgi:hypothetical protein